MSAKIAAIAAAAMALLPTAIHAAPAAGSSASYVADFENIYNGVPAVAVQPINEYFDLYYNAFVIATPARLAGVAPRSGAQFGAYGIDSIFNQGQPALTAAAAQSPVASFDLRRFYFGCVVNTAQGVATVATPCSVTATGYAAGGRQVASQTFAFEPAKGALLSNMTAAALTGFEGVQSVNFTTASPSVLTGKGAFLASAFDDFEYTVHYK